MNEFMKTTAFHTQVSHQTPNLNSQSTISNTMSRNIERLKTELQGMRYKSNLDQDKQIFISGHPSVFLPIIHFSLLSYSKPVSQYIQDQGFELYAQNDYAFINSVYEILNLLFKYKPPFLIDQFFTVGLAERKVTFILDLLSLIRSKNSVLNKRSSSQKPKSVTFKEENEKNESSEKIFNPLHKIDMFSTLNLRNNKDSELNNIHIERPSSSQRFEQPQQKVGTQLKKESMKEGANKNTEKQANEQRKYVEEIQQRSKINSNHYDTQDKSSNIMMKNYASKPPVVMMKNVISVTSNQVQDSSNSIINNRNSRGEEDKQNNSPYQNQSTKEKNYLSRASSITQQQNPSIPKSYNSQRQKEEKQRPTQITDLHEEIQSYRSIQGSESSSSIISTPSKNKEVVSKSTKNNNIYDSNKISSDYLKSPKTTRNDKDQPVIKQVEKISKQNADLAILIGGFHEQMKKLTLQFDIFQNSVEQKFDQVVSSNQLLHQRLERLESKFKKVCQIIKFKDKQKGKSARKSEQKRRGHSAQRQEKENDINMTSPSNNMVFGERKYSNRPLDKYDQNLGNSQKSKYQQLSNHNNLESSQQQQPLQQNIHLNINNADEYISKITKSFEQTKNLLEKINNQH